ncbi:MAG: hypothetical protein J6T35_04230, partial [Bacteroidales bacterium]|nr:hypothetical protein [Bacteroidales bacterium]
MAAGKDVYCGGIFLSARWFVLSQVAKEGLHLVVLPTQEAAEYCSADLYNLVEGDRIFFLPYSGKGIERSNYKSSLCVQRTAALGKIAENKGELTFIVTWPAALEEKIPDNKTIRQSIWTLRKGDEISFDELLMRLYDHGFEKVDFVSAPGQFAVRGSLIDIFSFSLNNPYRISFWGNEIEKIHVFDSNTQLSIEDKDTAEIISNIVSDEEKGTVSIAKVLPKKTRVWLDSSDMYKEMEFFQELTSYQRVFLEPPLGLADKEDIIRFNITPQPTFNTNFELLTEDIRSKIESGYRVLIYGEKGSQLERIRSILFQNGGIQPEFVQGKNIHNG